MVENIIKFGFNSVFAYPEDGCALINKIGFYNDNGEIGSTYASLLGRIDNIDTAELYLPEKVIGTNKLQYDKKGIFLLKGDKVAGERMDDLWIHTDILKGLKMSQGYEKISNVNNKDNKWRTFTEIEFPIDTLSKMDYGRKKETKVIKLKVNNKWHY